MSLVRIEGLPGLHTPAFARAWSQEAEDTDCAYCHKEFTVDADGNKRAHTGKLAYEGDAGLYCSSVCELLQGLDVREELSQLCIGVSLPQHAKKIMAALERHTFALAAVEDELLSLTARVEKGEK